MAKKGAASPVGAEKKAARPEINPLVYGDLVAKELLRQRQFGMVWGDLAKGECPKTLDEALASKTAEMATLEAKLGPGAARTSTYITNTMASFPARQNQASLEAGLGKAYKVLRAGI